MTTCGIFGETGTDSEIDKWLERMKEDKEKEDKKTENMIAIEATTKNKVGFDTYAQYQFLYPINQLKVTTWASDGESRYGSD